MFGIRFVKAPPTRYLVHFTHGKVLREGPGLSFFYWAPTSTLVSVPLMSADVPFVFNPSTADFQALTVQGQLTWRVTEPRRVAQLMDFSITPDGVYRAEDPERLPQRLVNATQVLCQGVVGRMALPEALRSSELLVREVLPALRKAEEVAMLGVEILGLTVLSLKPTPDMARALEAGARESLQRAADEAIYARRNAAVEQERTIKESELNTELVVEEKRRQIREAQVAGEIAVEEKRSTLVAARAGNDKLDADAKAYALEASMKPIRDMDWRTLAAVASHGADPRATMALAFRELAENAQKIGELNISPDLLNSLLAPPRK
jgi:hypothetical protein